MTQRTTIKPLVAPINQGGRSTASLALRIPTAIRETKASPRTVPRRATASACANIKIARSRFVAPTAFKVPNTLMLSTTAENIESATITNPTTSPKIVLVPNVIPIAVFSRM